MFHKIVRNLACIFEHLKSNQIEKEFNRLVMKVKIRHCSMTKQKKASAQNIMWEGTATFVPRTHKNNHEKK